MQISTKKVFGNTLNRLFPLFFLVALFSVIFIFLLKCLSGAQKLEIDIAADDPDTLRVYYSNSGTFRESYSSPAIGIDRERSKKKVLLENGFANFIRLDTGLKKGRAKIYGIKVFGFFTSPLVLSPPEIELLFSSSPDASMEIFPDRLEVLSTGGDPYIFCKKPLYRPQYLKSFMLALLFTLFTVPLLLSHRRDSTENVTRLEGISPQTSTAGRFKALDGLRGFAALMVIADHTWGWFSGVGASGVWIFFALSGFLLARPFIGQPHLVLSISYMSQYIRRRLLRILPMYFVYIFVVFAINGRLNLALMHCLLLEGDGHLWAIPQEIIFYFLWPLVVILLILPFHKCPKLSIIILAISAITWNRLVGADKIWLLGMNHIKLSLFFGIFLTGAFFSSMYSVSSAYLATRSTRYKKLVSKLTSFIGLILLLFFVLLSTGHIFGERIVYSQMYFGTYGVLAGILIFCIVLAKERALDKFFSFLPLRAIGTVGFSLYLVHPLVMKIVQNISILFFDQKLMNFSLFMATLVASYFLARFTYIYIEKPIFQYSDPLPVKAGFNN